MENCEPKAAKVFRLYAKRPYFLPAMAEASKANQIIIAKGRFTEEDTFNVRVSNLIYVTTRNKCEY